MKKYILILAVVIILALCIVAVILVKRPREISKKPSEVVFAERKVINLNRDWYYVVFKGSSFPEKPPSSGWKKIDIPYLIYSQGYRGAWFKKNIYSPKLEGERRILLVFYGVKYKCRIYINGKLVYEHCDGFTPFTVDITDYVKWNTENEVLACVLDWTSALVKKVNLSNLKHDERPVDRAVDAITYPIGSKYYHFGIWDDVELWIVPAVWVKDVYIKTFYRNSTIAVEVITRNDYSKDLQVTVLNKVLDKGKEVLGLPAKQVLVKAGGEAKIVVWSKWKNPKLWAPWSPYLYNLSTIILVDGKKTDVKTTRFGFREFWVEDGSYYFNGVKIVLRMASTHLLGYTREKALETYMLLKNLSVNAMRLHAQPWPRIWYDLADEMGIMIVHESAVWCLGKCYRVEDPVFWQNFAEHLKGQVLLHRNHPSIVIWSIENELLLTGGYRSPETAKQLAKLAALVKLLDPTRPVMFEGDFDPLGAADIINLHYPHEFPKHDQYPNTAYWLENTTMLDSYPRIPWKWNRTKPLHIGEFLWVPFTSYDVPAAFFGDIVYTDPERYYIEAKAYAWSFQIAAYRIMRVSGFCPWNIFESRYSQILRKVVAETYKPITVFQLNYDNSFYEEATIQRKLAVVNDHYKSVKLKLGCILHYRNTSTKVLSNEISLNPAEVAFVDFTLALPKAEKLKEKAVLQIILLNGSEEIFNKNTTLYIYSKGIKCSENTTIYLLGEDQATETALKELGANIVKNKIPEKGLVIVARNSLTTVDWSKLLDFAEKGGIVLVLEQDSIPPNPLGVKLADHYSTITIPITLDHPLFANMTIEDLRFWRRDHIVSYRDLAIPALWPTFSLVSSGVGLHYSQLLEVRCGKGAFVFSQLTLVAKFSEEPRARLLLARLIDYYSSYKPPYAKTGVYYKSLELAAILDSMGADFSIVDASNLSKYDVVLVTASTVNEKDIEYFRKFCEKGGVLYLYHVDSESIGLLEKLTGLNFRYLQGYPPVVFVKDSLVKLMGNNLLYWTQSEKMWRHGPYVLDESVTEGILIEEVKPYNLTKISLLKFKASNKEVVSIKENTIALYSNSYISTVLHVNESGFYAISIGARGTLVQGVYPVMEIWMNRSRIWSTYVSRRAYYTYVTYLSKGTYVLSIAFINDAWIPGKEDRNLYIYEVAFGKIKELRIKPLTNPYVLTQIPLGKGYVIVDQVPWLKIVSSRIKLNYFKALKYSYLLLSSLGVPFRASSVILLEPKDFTLRKGVGSISSWQVALYSNGYVSATLKIVEEGYYTIGILAKGTKTKGEYPVAQIYLNSTLLGEIKVNSSYWQEYRLLTYIKRGVYELKIFFINDYWNPPKEDRNLYVSLVVVRKVGEPHSF
ncbi:MAG: hypothetical protein DRN04_08950 [Thermoprotei archaeon]|nr:MAG: hypothetical protein DRN04_08950 [Thermoprotei archaeon]